MESHIDEELINELQSVLEDEFENLIKAYISDSDDRIEGLKLALVNQDSPSLREYSHSFKGSSCNIGANVLSEYCHQAENIGRLGHLSEADALIKKIENEYTLVKEQLKNRLH